MAIKLADMYVDLDLRTAGFQGQMAAANASMAKGTVAQRGMQKSTAKTGMLMGKMATVAKVGAAAVGVGLVLGAKKAATAASDLEEAMNKVDVIFGRSAKNVTKWSEDAAEKTRRDRSGRC